jgi:hypothetical protein
MRYASLWSAPGGPAVAIDELLFMAYSPIEQAQAFAQPETHRVHEGQRHDAGAGRLPALKIGSTLSEVYDKVELIGDR